MKKAIVLLLSLLFAMTAFGCGGKSGNTAMYALKYDDQINADNGFDENLFYRNDLESQLADPQVFRIDDPDSDQNGWFYMFGTSDATLGVRGYTCWRSKDLTHWENYSAIVGFPAFFPSDDHFGFEDYWAPEVVYDPDDGLYYMYYSCTATGTTHYVMGLAVASEPYGPYLPYEDETHDASTPFFDQEQMMARVAENEKTSCFETIDPHPYIAPDGQKYLYFVRDKDDHMSRTHIWGMRMNSWTDPDYSTLTKLTKTGYYTVDGDEMTPYEGTDNSINEGPFIYESKQADGSYRYYLTLSINGYRDKTYSVVQAVGDSPLGPFTKLKQEDGGVLLGTDDQKFDHISGPGHHSFVRVDDELFIVYHEHLDREKGDSQRAAAIDRVSLTKNGKGEEVMYVSGPTWSLLPKPGNYGTYKNIAQEATVTADTGRNVEALTDNMLTIYSYISYVKEFEADGKATITMTFPDYREITGLMVFNSKEFAHTFINVSRVELDFKDEAKGVSGTAYIDNLAFNWDFYKTPGIQQMRPGGSAVALFKPMLVKSIRITVDPNVSRIMLDEDGFEDTSLALVDPVTADILQQTTVAVSEIAILGK